MTTWGWSTTQVGVRLDHDGRVVATLWCAVWTDVEGTRHEYHGDRTVIRRADGTVVVK